MKVVLFWIRWRVCQGPRKTGCMQVRMNSEKALKHLSDSELLTETRQLCGEERRITLQILHLLREIEARALFARTHSSLFDFCVKELRFSEDQAHRRISAMRQLRDVPELEAQVASGEIKLSQLAQVRTFVRAEKKETGRTVSREEARDLLTSLAGRSTRETERVLLEKSPALAERRRTEERIRVVAPTFSEVRFTADDELLALIQEAKSLVAHNADLNPSLAPILKKALAVWVGQLKKKKGLGESKNEMGSQIRGTKSGLPPAAPRGAVQPARSSSAPSGSVRPALESSPPGSAGSSTTGFATYSESSDPPAPRTRYISAPLRRLVYARARGQCEFGRPGERCESRHALEVHHLTPFARGGLHTAENLILACRIHNAAEGRWEFG